MAKIYHDDDDDDEGRIDDDVKITVIMIIITVTRHVIITTRLQHLSNAADICSVVFLFACVSFLLIVSYLFCVLCKLYAYTIR